MTSQVNNQSTIPSTDVIQLTLTLKMTTAQVIETSVTVNNSSLIQDHVYPDDQTQPTFNGYCCEVEWGAWSRTRWELRSIGAKFLGPILPKCMSQKKFKEKLCILKSYVSIIIYLLFIFLVRIGSDHNFLLLNLLVSILVNLQVVAGCRKCC